MIIILPLDFTCVRLLLVVSAITTENQSSNRLPMACNADGEHCLAGGVAGTKLIELL